jgi:hypothetical protein
MEGGAAMKQVKVSLPDEVLEKTRQEARSLGMSPGAVVRLRHCERMLGFNLELPEKPYLVQPKNWREIEAYVRVKKCGPVENFFIEAAEALMRRNALTAAQKTEFERLLEK